MERIIQREMKIKGFWRGLDKNESRNILRTKKWIGHVVFPAQSQWLDTIGEIIAI